MRIFLFRLCSLVTLISTCTGNDRDVHSLYERYFRKTYEDKQDYEDDDFYDNQELSLRDRPLIQQDVFSNILHQSTSDQENDEPSELFRDIENSFDDDESRQFCHFNPLFSFSNAETQRLIGGLHHMLKFWERNYQKISVDGLFGIRSAEGSIKHALNSMNSAHALYKNMEHLLNRTQTTAEKIYSTLKRRNTTYGRGFLKLLKNPFYFQRAWKNFDPDLVWKIIKVPSLSEKKSDNCMQELLNSCKVSNKCFKTETVRGSKYYRLTHQALYFFVGETNGCHQEVVKAVGNKRTLDKLYDTFGSNIYSQMMKKNLDNSMEWDIFLEQGLICKDLGIVECARRDKVLPVLDWIEKEGCLYNPVQKRQDVLIGRCTTHTTSVAMGHLASQLSFIFNPPSCHLVN